MTTYRSLHQIPPGQFNLDSLQYEIGWQRQHKIPDKYAGRPTWVLVTKFQRFPAGRYRVWIPDGTISAQLTIIMLKQTYVRTAMSFNLPDISGEYPQQVPVDLDQLDGGETARCYSGPVGNLVPLRHNGVTKGSRWLNIFVSCEQGDMLEFTLANTVAVPEYLKWYNGATWYANGDPGGDLPPPSPPPPPPPPPPPDDRQAALDALDVARGYILTH